MRALQKEQSAVWTEDYPEKTYQDRDYTNKLTVPSISFDKIHKLIPNFSGNIEDITTALRNSLEKHFVYEDYEVGQQPGLKTFNSEPERYVDIFRKAFSGHLQTRPQVNTAFRNFLLMQLVARDNVSDLTHLAETVEQLKRVLTEFVQQEKPELAEGFRAYLDQHTQAITKVIREEHEQTREENRQEHEQTRKVMIGPQRPNALDDPNAPHLPRPDRDPNTFFIFEKISIGIRKPAKAKRDEAAEALKPYDLYWNEDPDAYRGQQYDVLPADDIWEAWLQQPQTVHVLSGEPGSGKTTMLRKWANNLHARRFEAGGVRDSLPAVFYLPLRDMKEGVSPVGYLKELVGDTHSLDAAPHYRGEKNAVWLFDGWDELGTKLQEVWIDYVNKARGVRVVSCRTAVYNQIGKPFGQDALLWGLDRDTRRDYLQEFFEARKGTAGGERFSRVDDAWIKTLLDKLHSHSTLRELAASPLLLRLIAENTSTAETPANPPEIDLPANRATFHERAFYSMLERRANIKRREARRLKQLLVGIARGTQLAALSFESEVLFDAIDEDDKVPNDSDTLLVDAGILRPVGVSDERYEFIHLTFQEWLFAESLHNDGDPVAAVKAFWERPTFEETLAILWGLMDEKQRLAATTFLAEDAGCVKTPHSEGNATRIQTRSGLRTALHLWTRSGVEINSTVNQESCAVLWKSIQQGKICNVKRLAVSHDSRTPPALLTELAKDEDSDVRRGVAQNPNIASNTLKILAEDKNSSVRWGVLLNPNAKPETLKIFAEDKNSSVRWGVAEHHNTTPDTLKILAKDKDYGVRRMVPLNPNITPDTLKILAQDEDALVRRPVAHNPKTTPEILEILTVDEDRGVRWGVAINPNITPNTLERLSKDEDSGVRQGVAQNPNATPETLEKLAEVEDRDVRRGVAYNPNTTSNTLKKLAKDKDNFVRWGVAINPNITPDTLEKLSKDEDSGLRQGVAQNPNATPNTLERLSKDEDSGVRLRITTNTSTDPDTLAKLADDEAGGVRRSVAANTSMNPDMLAKLADDENSDVRRSVAANTSTSPDTLAKLADDEASSVRMRVAGNPNTCLEDL